jgi:hypothetical protein
MIRHSAAAALVNAIDAISASHPVFNLMPPPTRPHAAAPAGA